VWCVLSGSRRLGRFAVPRWQLRANLRVRGRTTGSGRGPRRCLCLAHCSRQRLGFITGLPLLDEARKAGFNLIPGSAGHQSLQLCTHLTVVADASFLARPGAAAGVARLQHVVAGETEDLEVCLVIAAALQYGKPMMHLQHTFRGRRPAHLTRAAAGLDQRASATVRQRLGAGPSVVGGSHAVAGGAPSYEGGESVFAARRAGAAEDNQVVSSRRPGRLDLEDEKGPPPVQPARLAGSRAPALERKPDARS